MNRIPVVFSDVNIFDIHLFVSLETIINYITIIGIIIISSKLQVVNCRHTMVIALFTLLYYNNSNRKQIWVIWMVLQIWRSSEEEIVNIWWVSTELKNWDLFNTLGVPASAFVSNNACEHFSLNSRNSFLVKEIKKNFKFQFYLILFQNFYSVACILGSFHCLTDVSSNHCNLYKKKKNQGENFWNFLLLFVFGPLMNECAANKVWKLKQLVDWLEKWFLFQQIIQPDTTYRIWHWYH